MTFYANQAAVLMALPGLGRAMVTILEGPAEDVGRKTPVVPMLYPIIAPVKDVSMLELLVAELALADIVQQIRRPVLIERMKTSKT